VRPGRILFEMAGVEHEAAVEAMRLASHKLPVQTKVVLRDTTTTTTKEVTDGDR
jgi:large subunit ribosomal protein L16